MQVCLGQSSLFLILVATTRVAAAVTAGAGTTASLPDSDYGSGTESLNVTMSGDGDGSSSEPNVGSIVIGIAFTAAGLIILAAFAYVLCKKVKGQDLETFNNPIKFEDETTL